MPYFDLDHLYKFLSPDFSSGNNPPNSSTTVAKPFYQKVAELLIDSRGKSYSWEQINKEIENYQSDVAASDLADTKSNFRFLGPSKNKLSAEDKYFSGVESTSSVNPDLKDNKMTVIAIRDPRVTISTAACDKVGRFLNYTPPIIASQMIPYLDVEFRLIGNSEFTRAPSTLRFLLGVVKGDDLGSNDKTMFEGSMKERTNRTDKNKPKDWEDRAYMRSGMELFLMPQSLTNMDGLGAESSGAKTRTAPAKPFLPLASIEGFDITLRNAGAKNFQHQTGNLKLKVHDKSRLSEMAEFIRGGDGFRQVEIITRYGWAVPEVSREENEFFHFINNEMVKEDVWAIVNTQMSFDSTGQANIGIQLVNAGARYLGRTDIVEVENPNIEKFNEIVAKIAKYVDKIQSSNKFPTTVTIATILKDASSKGIYTLKDSQKIANEIADYDKLLQKQSVLTDEDRVNFKNALLELNKPISKNSKSATKSLYELAQLDARNEIEKKISGLKRGTPDPWLPKQGGPFNPKLINEVKRKKETGVASFAKVMLYFGKLLSKDVNEVQFVFYAVNDGAGYAGRSEGNNPISLAEFPIDLQLLEKVIFTRIKDLNTTSLKIEEFTRLLVEENFSDARSIAYGKSSYYTAFEEGKKEPPKVTNNSEPGLKAWEKENPEFVQCQIDINVSVESPKDNPDYKIKKIHIYDKETKIFNDFSSMTVDQKKEELQNGVPLITIGSNGSLILNSAVASKTDGSQQAVYLAQAMKANPDTGTINPNKNPVSEPDNNLPLRTLPVQLTMTSLGCPIAKLYQKYFVDFFTGTSIDNLYMCNQIQHTINPGKFTTSWTFMQDTGGYSRFNKPTLQPVKSEEAKVEPSPKAKKAASKAKKPENKKTVSGQTAPAEMIQGVPFVASVPAVPPVRKAGTQAPLPGGGKRTGEP